MLKEVSAGSRQTIAATEELGKLGAALDRLVSEFELGDEGTSPADGG